MAKPDGTSSSIFVVVAPSFSVGTDSVNTCSSPALATGGLTTAWARAPGAAMASAASAPATGATNVFIGNYLRFEQLVCAGAHARGRAASDSAGEGRRWRTREQRFEREEGAWEDEARGRRDEREAFAGGSRPGPERARGDASRPGEQVLGGADNGRGDQRERAAHRERVDVHGP